MTAFSVLGLDPITSTILIVAFLLLYAIGTGVLGGLLGLGGGLFVVPLLVLVFHVAPAVAIAASLVAVIATSSGAASNYVGEGLSDLRVGMFLEVATVIGGVLGALITVVVLAQEQQLLLFAFVPAVLAPAGATWKPRTRRGPTKSPPPSPSSPPSTPVPIA